MTDGKKQSLMCQVMVALLQHFNKTANKNTPLKYYDKSTRQKKMCHFTPQGECKVNIIPKSPYKANIKTTLGNDGTVPCNNWCPRIHPGSKCVASYETNTGNLIANDATNVVNGKKLKIISKCLPSKEEVPIPDKNPICSSHLSSNGGTFDRVYQKK